MSDEVQLIPVGEIHIVNPRHRDPKKFEIIVQSIKNLGLKVPIQVSPRATAGADGFKYDLICGQGRLEAFMALGYPKIPAMVVEIAREDLLVRSLVENIARRYPQPMDLIREMERLKGLGNTAQQIGNKLDVSDSLVHAYLRLRQAGEERLLEAAVTGKIPIWVAVDIAKTETAETQRELLKAYEEKKLDYKALKYVKGLMQSRRLLGKQRGGRSWNARPRSSIESMVNTYRKESQRQKLMIKKAKVCEAKLAFIVTAFNKLLADENFVTLLRAEKLATLPRYLAEKLTVNLRQAA